MGGGRRGIGALSSSSSKTSQKVQWCAEDRWVVDEEAKLWTCGETQTGTDMMATYIKENFHLTVVGFVMTVGDFEIRQQKYPAA